MLNELYDVCRDNHDEYQFALDAYFETPNMDSEQYLRECRAAWEIAVADYFAAIADE